MKVFSGNSLPTLIYLRVIHTAGGVWATHDTVHFADIQPLQIQCIYLQSWPASGKTEKQNERERGMMGWPERHGHSRNSFILAESVRSERKER